MKRLALLLALLPVATGAQAFNPEEPATIRIGVLRYSETSDDGRLEAAPHTVPALIRDALRKQGFDAFTTDRTFEEIERATERDADYYVEVVSSGRYHDPYAGVGIGGRHADVTLGLVKTTVEARVIVYDAKLFDIARFDLAKGKTAVTPVGAGIGTRTTYAWFGMPIAWLQYRSAARQLAKEAADKVAETIRNP